MGFVRVKIIGVEFKHKHLAEVRVRMQHHYFAMQVRDQNLVFLTLMLLLLLVSLLSVAAVRGPLHKLG